MSQSNLLLHPKTAQALQMLQNTPGGKAYLFTGKQGVGKFATAKHFIAQILEFPNDKLVDTSPKVYIVEPQGKSYGIEESRSIAQHLKTKRTDDSVVQRVIVLENIQSMTIEAQNALLKTLEELPASSVVVATATSSTTLRPTVLSRMIKIAVLPVQSEHVVPYFQEQGYQTSDIERYYLLSGGKMGLLTSLLEQQDSALIDGINSAKEFLGASIFNRLCQVDKLSKQKDSLQYFVEGLKRVADVSLQSQFSKNGQQSAKNRWLKILDETLETQQAILLNGNVKLALTALALRV